MEALTYLFINRRSIINYTATQEEGATERSVHTTEATNIYF